MDNSIPNFINVDSGNNRYINNGYQQNIQQPPNELSQYNNFNPMEYIPMAPSFNPINNNNSQLPPRQIQQQQNNYSLNTEATNYTNDINNRMNSFTFDRDCFVSGSLVPVDKNHFYSRNLFQEGIPMPQDLQQQNPQSLTQRKNLQPHLPQNQFKNGHQFRPKTMYKEELNDRLQNLSPLGNKLYMPIDTNHQMMPNPQPSWQLSAKSDRKDTMNERLGQIQPMASVSSINDINN